MNNRIHRLFICSFLAFSLPAIASDYLTESAARKLATETLETVESAQQALRIAINEHTQKRYRQRIILPLKHTLNRWEQAPHLTAADKKPYRSCVAAADDLLDIARHIAQGNERRAEAISHQFEVSLNACKSAIYGR